MRPLPLLFIFAFTAAGRLFAPPVTGTGLVGTIPATAITGLKVATIDLRNYFSENGVTGNALQFNTAEGTFYVQMNPAAAPNTVANFLTYVNAGSFTNSLIHRSDPVTGVIQGGSFTPNTTGTTFTNYNNIGINAPIALETTDTLVNSLGTIAMARTTSPNSATSGWFINTVDNTNNLPPASNSGYAVFGSVISPGMSVVNAIAALPVLNGNITVISSSTSSNAVTVDPSTLPASFGQYWGFLGSYVSGVAGPVVSLYGNANQTISSSTTVATSLYGDPFSQLPVQANLPVGQTGSVSLSNLVTVSSITPVFPITAGGPALATFSATSSDKTLVNPSVSGSILHLYAAKNFTTASPVTITVTVTDSNGSSQSSFNVTVTRQILNIHGGTETNLKDTPDFVFQNSASGQIYTWFLDGSGNAVTGTQGLAPGSKYLFTGALGDWQLVGMGDVNGDGIPDLIYQNTAGQIYTWFLDGSGNAVSGSQGLAPGSKYLFTGALGDWRVVGVGDVNGDGIPDLIFQNTAGQIYAWFLDGSGNAVSGTQGVIGSKYLFTGGLGDWRVVGVGDVNGDGIPDLIFQNTAGQIYAWFLDGSGNAVSGTQGVVGSKYLFTGGLGDWRIKGIGDMNGDGIPDLIFQNTAGQIYEWLLDGSGNAVTGTQGVVGSKYLFTSGLNPWRLLY
jgi:cyclophilin family peptidyl-prolyl cis-trans isomerase